MATFEQLKASVTKTTGVEASALTFIQGLVEQLKNAGTDEERQAIIDQLEAQADALAAAIATNPGTPGRR